MLLKQDHQELLLKMPTHKDVIGSHQDQLPSLLTAYTWLDAALSLLREHSLKRA